MLFVNDPETEIIVLIGEIGGQLEADAAKWYHESNSKKTCHWIYCRGNCTKRQKNGTCWCNNFCVWRKCQRKVEILSAAGVTVAPNPAVIGDTIAKVMKEAA